MIHLIVRVRCRGIAEETLIRQAAKGCKKLKGYRSHDKNPRDVKLYLNALGLPYSSKFVSVFVFVKGQGPNVPGGQAYKSFGVPFLLKNQVADELTIVCDDDIHDAVFQGYARSRFTDLRPLDPRKRRLVLAAAAKAAIKNRRGYAEARLFRTLKRSDIDSILS